MLIFRPAVDLLGQADLFLAHRSAVDLAGVLLVRRPPADDAAGDDHRGPIAGLLEHGHRRTHRRQVVHVGHLSHVPAVGQESLLDALAEGQGGAAFDGDAVVVVDPAEVRQLQMPGQRGGLRADPFHHVAVAAEGVDVEVEQLKARPIVAGCQPTGGDRHADAVADALAQRAGRRLDAAGVAVLGVAGAAARELAEAFDILQPHGRLAGGPALGVHLLHAGQMQHRVEQHRGMPSGQHEAIAVGPVRRLGIVVHHLVVEDVGHRRQGHRRAGMSALGRLDGVHGEGPDGVDRQLFQRSGRNGHGRRFLQIATGNAPPTRARGVHNRPSSVEAGPGGVNAGGQEQWMVGSG